MSPAVDGYGITLTGWIFAGVLRGFCGVSPSAIDGNECLPRLDISKPATAYINTYVTQLQVILPLIAVY